LTENHIKSAEPARSEAAQGAKPKVKQLGNAHASLARKLQPQSGEKFRRPRFYSLFWRAVVPKAL